MIQKFWRALGRVSFWLTWPGIAICMFFSTRTRVVVAVGNEVLLVQGWLGSGRWQLPGGGLRHKEKPPDGAARELREETGIVLEPSNFTLLETKTKTFESGIRFHYISFIIELPSKPHLTTSTHEINATKWIHINQLFADPSVSNNVKSIVALWKKA